MQAAKALVRLHKCPGLSQSWLLIYAISTTISPDHDDNDPFFHSYQTYSILVSTYLETYSFNPTAFKRDKNVILKLIKVRPTKKISVFRVTGLKILGRVGHIFFLIIFFFWKKI